MKRKTSTQKLATAISNSLLMVQKAEVYHISTRKTEPVGNKKFVESLGYFNESEIFSDAMGWSYWRDYKSGCYISECGRLDAYAEDIVTVYLRVGDGVNTEDVERILRIEEE